MTSNRPVWKFPWSYIEGFFIASGLLVAGAAIQFATSSYIPLPAQPFNLVALPLFVALLIFIQLRGKRNPLVIWLSSVPASISAILLLTFLAILMGLIRQDENAPATLLFLNIKHSWMYLLAQVYILTTLGLTAIRRFSLRLKNAGFMLNHLGLWIVLAGAAFGSGDIERYTMRVEKGTVEWIGIDRKNQLHELPVAIFLEDFKVDYYPPQAGVWSVSEEKLLKTPSFNLTSADTVFIWNQFEFEIKQVLQNAWLMGDTFREAPIPGAVHAAQVCISENKSVKQCSWICSASSLQQPFSMTFGDDYELVMKPPKARLYQSDVTVYTKDGKEISSPVTVNKPVSIDGWKIYQFGYDESMGQWSTSSVFELVRDPWLPAIYTGLCMLLCGAIFIFITGVTAKRKTE
ncbi:MAG: hypothetical protein A2W93_07300 [Bacteroidetes bacterium GWF2_43_63]|nr:MAG: hypothetical protein A2W94_15370 [Bacteroidetes bacterium GWE2_42_42]OFY54035.1 MAG: hypothetical protein A2W93_07300 [Bacteroidetes bacterium GWF2_43_63]HCB63557.1 hypothetical protein [Bacteroidales bacterium]HCY23197.1 hypothetical protein [Bacteroidales bacterium]